MSVSPRPPGRLDAKSNVRPSADRHGAAAGCSLISLQSLVGEDQDDSMLALVACQISHWSGASVLANSSSRPSADTHGAKSLTGELTGAPSSTFPSQAS